MTSLQIEYWKNYETRRHNLEMEKQGRATISENIRHDYEGESIGRAQAAAAAAQAAVARYRASIDASYLSMEQQKLPYVLAQNERQLGLVQAQAQKTRAEASLTEAKTQYQQLQNAVYARYGMQQGGADLGKTYAGIATSVLSSAREFISGATSIIGLVK